MSSLVEEAKRRQKAEKARNMRYKRSALASLGYEYMVNRLYEITEDCSNIRYYYDDISKLVDAFDGDEEEAYEFQMAFSDLSVRADNLLEEFTEISESEDIEKTYDYCTVALIGNRFNVVGFDSYEEDYYSLTRYEQNLAQTEAGKHLMQKTKAEMISTIGQCFGMAMAFYDLNSEYEKLHAEIDLLKGENASITKVIREIEELYEKVVDDKYDYKINSTFDNFVRDLPERFWIE